MSGTYIFAYNTGPASPCAGTQHLQRGEAPEPGSERDHVAQLMRACLEYVPCFSPPIPR